MRSNTPENTGIDKTILAPISQAYGTNVPVILHEQVQEPIQKTRSPIYAIVGSFFLSTGIAAGTGYAYLKQLGPFHPDPTTTTLPSSSAEVSSAEPDQISLPQVVDTAEKLQLVLQADHIKATAEDFEKSAQNNFYMNALALEPILDNTGSYTNPLQYKWTALKGQKFSSFQDSDILIATMIKAPRFADKLRHLGIQPGATAKDTDNAAIEYHYYHCTGPKSAGIASIAIVNDRERNLTLFPLHLPVCKEKPEENPKP